jgi:hypothetical protein
MGLEGLLIFLQILSGMLVNVYRTGADCSCRMSFTIASDVNIRVSEALHPGH